MKKTDKKIDTALIKALNQVCNLALDEINGFKWLTHRVNYKDYPASLVITCVFENNLDLALLLENKQDLYLYGLIKMKFSDAGISIKDIDRKVFFDSEEACITEHQGKWNLRLN